MRHSRETRFARALLASALLAWAGAPAPSLAQAPQANPLEEQLRARLSQAPGNASLWRMLGRLREQRGDSSGALDAFREAARLAPESAAAAFDLGRALLEAGAPEESATWLREAIDLAPRSEYARLSEALLADPRFVTPATQLSPVGPGDFLQDDPLETDRRRTFWSLALETGALYNSNVELAPISRELPASELASFQAYVRPDIELAVWDAPDGRMAATLEGYYSFNEGPFRDLNVAHHQPGVYVERYLDLCGTCSAARLEYDFAYDAFDGRRLGLRHAASASLATFHDDGGATQWYYTADYGQFDDDGLDPSESSLDGWTHTLGVSREWSCHGLCSATRLGVEGQWAPLEGDNFAYRGGLLYGGFDIPLAWQLLLLLDAGVGYRDYPDFRGAPSRNELTLFAGAELRHPLGPHCDLSGTFRFDRFDSENDDFAADRYTAGAFLTFRR